MQCGAVLQGSTLSWPNVVGNPAGDNLHPLCVTSAGDFTFDTCTDPDDGSPFDTYIRLLATNSPAGEQLADAKREAAGIIEAANKRAQAVVEEAKEAASAEAQRVKAAAAAEIEQERARAQEQLMTQVSALELAGAEKILAAEIDADKHADLLKSLAAES